MSMIIAMRIEFSKRIETIRQVLFTLLFEILFYLFFSLIFENSFSNFSHLGYYRLNRVPRKFF